MIFVKKVIRDNNATPSFLHLYGFPNSVCTSINEVVVHGIPSNQKLKEGDIISVDVGACYKGTTEIARGLMQLVK